MQTASPVQTAAAIADATAATGISAAKGSASNAITDAQKKKLETTSTSPVTTASPTAQVPTPVVVPVVTVAPNTAVPVGSSASANTTNSSKSGNGSIGATIASGQTTPGQSVGGQNLPGATPFSLAGALRSDAASSGSVPVAVPTAVSTPVSSVTSQGATPLAVAPGAEHAALQKEASNPIASKSGTASSSAILSANAIANSSSSKAVAGAVGATAAHAENRTPLSSSAPAGAGKILSNPTNSSATPVLPSVMQNASNAASSSAPVDTAALSGASAGNTAGNSTGNAPNGAVNPGAAISSASPISSSPATPSSSTSGMIGIHGIAPGSTPAGAASVVGQGMAGANGIDGHALTSAGGFSASNFAASRTSSSVSPSASDALAALDHVAAEPSLLRATPNQLAVGVSDPQLGWLEVRADRVGGQVTASITPDSSASHAVLAASMPAMTSFLQEQRAGVQSLALSNPWAGNTGQGAQNQNAQHFSQGNNGQANDNGGQGQSQPTWVSSPAGIGAVSSSAPAPGWNESSWNGSGSNSVHASTLGALPGVLPEQSGSQVSVLA